MQYKIIPHKPYYDYSYGKTVMQIEINDICYLQYQATTLDDVRSCKDGYHYKPINNVKNALSDNQVYYIWDNFCADLNKKIQHYNYESTYYFNC